MTAEADKRVANRRTSIDAQATIFKGAIESGVTAPVGHSSSKDEKTGIKPPITTVTTPQSK